VCGADHRPLAGDLVDAAEENLSETSGLLDVSEDRFDDVLAQPVSTSMAALPDSGANSEALRPVVERNRCAVADRG
jgi:hypothetical protein